RPWMRTSGAGSAMAVSASVTWWTWRDAIVKVFILLFCFKASPDWQAGHAAGRKRCTVTDAVDHESRSVLLDVAGDGVATLTLNRPHRHNAWNPVIERRFYQLLDEAGRDDRVRAVVLTGAGRSFCPGVDSQRLAGVAGRALGPPRPISPTRP